MDTITLILLVIAAFFTAVVSAVAGLGGGVGLMGVMTMLVPASAVVPLHGAVQLVSNLSRSLVYFRHVRWRIYLPFVALLGLGLYVSVRLWLGSDLSWFRPVIGGYVLAFVGWRRVSLRSIRIPLWAFSLVGLVAGGLTILVGAVGPFIAPFFVRDDMSQQEVVATKAACQLTLHVLKVPAFLALGFDYSVYRRSLVFLALAVIGGTLLGRWLINRLSQKSFLAVFDVLLCLIGARLLWSGIGPAL